MDNQIPTFHNLEDRVIRIFISSTFSDMQEERDLLVTKIFPRLAKMAAQRDVTIVPLDLRWGVTEEAAMQGKVIETCLNEIIHSRPFFIGLIGNRYGSCLTMEESQKNKELFKQYEWLAKDMEEGLSVTEIEIQYGVLRYPELIDAFFYLKEADECASDNPEKLTKLKKAIRENKRYPVENYATVKDLANKIEEQFLKILDKHFPDRPLSRLEKERLNQHIFMRSRMIAYIPLPEAYQALDDFLQNDKQNFVVTGDSGMGKSALIANWLCAKKNQTDLKIIYHFVGNGGLGGNYHTILQRLCDEIRDLYSLPQSDENKDDSKKLEDELKILFMDITGREPLLIALDGINQLSEIENAKQLLWLPMPPSNVKYLFSTLPDDRTMEVFKMRHYHVYTLMPLDMARRHLLVAAYLKEYGKELSKERVERIINDPQSENTLVLRSLLDELIGFGSHEHLDERINYYLEAQSIDDFFQRMLQRIEEDLGEQTVRHILSLVAFSQYGLSESEIMEMTGLSAYDWSVFHGVFRNYFTTKFGLLTFSHRYMAEACLVRYAEKAQYARREIIAKFSRQDDSRAWEELAFQYCTLKDGDNLYALLLRMEVFDSLYRKDKYQLGIYWRLLRGIDERKYTPTAYLDQIMDDLDKDHFYNSLGLFFSDVVFDISVVPLFFDKCLSIREIAPYLDYSATVRAYNNIGRAYSIQGNYSKALEYYLKALAIGENKLGVGHYTTATVYNNIGAAYSHIANYSKALEYFLKALNIGEMVFGTDHPSIALSYHNISSVYAHLGNYTKAFEYQLKALSIREKVFGLNHPDTALSYHQIGFFYSNEEKNYSKALEYLFKALNIREMVFGTDHPDTAISYKVIGDVFSCQEDYVRALEYCFKALTVQEKALGTDHPSTAVTYNSIGIAYCNQRNYPKALEFYFKALDIREKVLGMSHPETASSYNDIGNIYYSQEDYSRALEYYFKALDIQEKLGIDQTTVAIYYNNIGNTYCDQRNYPKALEFYFKALDIREKVLGMSHPETASSYNDIGNIYYSQEDYSRALEYYFKALDIQEKLGIDQTTVAIYYNNIGNTYCDQRNYPKALEFYFKALDIREKVLGMSHPETASSYNDIGNIYYSQEDYSRALEYYFKALDIQEKLGIDQTTVAIYYNNIGNTYCDQRNYPKALEFYFKALDIREKVLGMSHPETASSYNDIGNIYYSQEDYSRALEYYFKALDIQEKLGIDQTTVAIYYNNIGNTYCDQRNYPKALEFYFKTLDIREKVLGVDHPDTVTVYNNIGVTYENSSNFLKALEYYFKTLQIRKQVFGLENSETIYSYNDVGAMYEFLGEYEKAIQYYSEALVQRQKVYGNEHIETSKSYKNIGKVYTLQADYAKALEYYGKALSIREKELGKDHDDTITVKQELEKINLHLNNINGKNHRA